MSLGIGGQLLAQFRDFVEAESRLLGEFPPDPRNLSGMSLGIGGQLLAQFRDFVGLQGDFEGAGLIDRLMLTTEFGKARFDLAFERLNPSLRLRLSGGAFIDEGLQLFKFRGKRGNFSFLLIEAGSELQGAIIAGAQGFFEFADRGRREGPLFPSRLEFDLKPFEFPFEIATEGPRLGEFPFDLDELNLALQRRFLEFGDTPARALQAA